MISSLPHSFFTLIAMVIQDPMAVFSSETVVDSAKTAAGTAERDMVMEIRVVEGSVNERRLSCFFSFFSFLFLFLLFGKAREPPSGSSPQCNRNIAEYSI